MIADESSTYHRTNNPNANDRRPDSLGYYHTNFALKESGESIELSRWTDANNDDVINDTTELSFGWVCQLQGGQTFGEQAADQSMGCYIDPAGALQFGFLRVPTPGRHNSGGYADSGWGH